MIGTASGHRLTTCVVAMAALGVSGFFQDAVRKLGADAQAFIPAPPQYAGLTIDPQIIRRLLGTRLLFADLIWIDTVIKADITHERESFTPIYRAFKAVTVLDPDNLVAYYVAGSYLSVIKDDIKGATAILREGARYMQTHEYAWGDAWSLPFVLGYNLVFEEHEVEEGAQWIREAAKFEKAPQIVKTLAEKVGTERGQLDVAAKILNEVHRRVTRPEERAKVEAKMADVASRQDLLDLNEKFELFLKGTGAYAFSKQKQLQLFLRSIGHSKFDLLGRPLTIDATGKIAPAAPTR